MYSYYLFLTIVYRSIKIWTIHIKIGRQIFQKVKLSKLLRVEVPMLGSPDRNDKLQPPNICIGKTNEATPATLLQSLSNQENEQPLICPPFVEARA